MRFTTLALLSVLALFGNTSSVDAQGVDDVDAPIGLYVVDVHGAVAPWGQPIDLAVARDLDPTAQPSLGLGIGGGAHLYLLRWKFLTIGVGGSVLYASGSNTPSPEEPDVETPDIPLPVGPALRRTFTAVSSQLSFNFGGRNGWSYVSAGPGTSRTSLYEKDGPTPTQRSTSTFNYGGGARWFTNDHLAFALDLRFYNARPLEQTETEPGSPRVTTMVLSIGASFK